MAGTEIDIDIDDGCPICTSLEISFKLEIPDGTVDSEGFTDGECKNCGFKWKVHFTVKGNKDEK